MPTFENCFLIFHMLCETSRGLPDFFSFLVIVVVKLSSLCLVHSWGQRIFCPTRSIKTNLASPTRGKASMRVCGRSRTTPESSSQAIRLVGIMCVVQWGNSRAARPGLVLNKATMLPRAKQWDTKGCSKPSGLEYERWSNLSQLWVTNTLHIWGVSHRWTRYFFFQFKTNGAVSFFIFFFAHRPSSNRVHQKPKRGETPLTAAARARRATLSRRKTRGKSWRETRPDPNGNRWPPPRYFRYFYYTVIIHEGHRCTTLIFSVFVNSVTWT